MAPTHVTKRQAAPRAAATKKAAARTGNPDVTKEETTTAVEPAPGLAVEPNAVTVAPAEGRAEGTEAPEAPTAAPAAPEPAEAAPAPRASLLQALAAGQAEQAATPAADAPAKAVKLDGRREVWADGEDTVDVAVIADLFKANINGVPRYGYRGNVLTLPAAVAERGIRFGALTKEF